jgi:hypothetical protein
MVEVGGTCQAGNAGGVGEVVAGEPQANPASKGGGVLVAVHRDAVVQVDHGCHADPATGEELGVGEQGADALDPGDRRGEPGQGQVGQVDVQVDAGTQPLRLGLDQRAEQLRRERRGPRHLLAVALRREQQLERVGRASEPAQSDRAQLVASAAGVAVGDQVGDALDHRVDPDRVSGVDPGDHVSQAELVGA